MATLASWIARERPAAVVVDVSVEVALLARLCGTPVVVVALPGERTDRTHRAAYDLADALLAPWPAEAHARDWPASWTDEDVVRGSAVTVRRQTPSTVAAVERGTAGSSPLGRGRA